MSQQGTKIGNKQKTKTVAKLPYIAGNSWIMIQMEDSSILTFDKDGYIIH